VSFVKLDCGILNSTLWVERPQRDVFLTALLMAVPREFQEPVQQIAHDSTKPTGYVVPAGWYGFVAAAGPGICRQAIVDMKQGLEALRALGEPEAESRSADFEGRRMIRIDGGYIILNYMRYRDHDANAAQRMRVLRERRKVATSANAVTEHVPPLRRTVTEAEAEAEAEAEKKQKRQDDSKRGARLPDGWKPSDSVRKWAASEFPKLNLGRALAEFVDYWRAIPGQRGCKLDWDATFRNRLRVLGDKPPPRSHSGDGYDSGSPSPAAMRRLGS
jgi:hypothetical protein